MSLFKVFFECPFKKWNWNWGSRWGEKNVNAPNLTRGKDAMGCQPSSLHPRPTPSDSVPPPHYPPPDTPSTPQRCALCADNWLLKCVCDITTTATKAETMAEGRRCGMAVGWGRGKWVSWRIIKRHIVTHPWNWKEKKGRWQAKEKVVGSVKYEGDKKDAGPSPLLWPLNGCPCLLFRLLLLFVIVWTFTFTLSSWGK